jgi:hypothetical protein
MFVFFVIAGWIGGTVFINTVAKQRGRDPSNWILLSLFFSPLLAFIVLYCMKDLKAENEERQQKNEEDYYKNNFINTAEFIDSLKTICSLFENNIISTDEFIAKKNGLIDTLINKMTMDNPDKFLLNIIPFTKDNKLTKNDIQRIKSLLSIN